MHAGKAVIFCATQRTGSTLVFDDFLNVVGSGRLNSEILYERTALKKTQLPWNELWNELKELNRVHDYFFGKVMFHYTPLVSGFIERNSTSGVVYPCLKFIPELFDSFRNFFADAIWVYVERRNVFAQAVSMYLAETTNVWEKLQGDAVPACMDGADTIEAVSRNPSRRSGVPPGCVVRYEYEKLKGYLQGFLREREQWQLFFRHYKIAPIRISYEDAASAYPQYLRELLDQTGLQAVEALPPRRMLKVGGQRNAEWAEFLRNDAIAELYSRSHAGG
ncbi:MAG TPA: Stf0 family sulfotransferase [Candidatus Sulfotelmatobacter sp.]|nr:Stf0 family sulfotransferase [Candidatus Sulfotelmatobacter sp.]